MMPELSGLRAATVAVLLLAGSCAVQGALILDTNSMSFREGTANSYTALALAYNNARWAQARRVHEKYARTHPGMELSALDACGYNGTLSMCKLADCLGRCGAQEVCVLDNCRNCSARCLTTTAFQQAVSDMTLGRLPNLTRAHEVVVTESQKAYHSLLVSPGHPCPNSSVINWRTSIINEGECHWMCKECPNGTISRGLGPLVCRPCTPGTSADRARGRCAPCAPGTYSAGFAAAACRPCPARTFAPKQGSVACIPCLLGSAKKPGAAACVKT